MKITSAGAFVVALLAHPLAPTPAQTSTTPGFEVASVKPNKGDGPTESAVQPGGRVTMINVPLRALIRSAYQVQDEQIVDAPGWISAEHFDVVAKAAGDVTPPTPGSPGPVQLMMRSLLAERFKPCFRRSFSGW